MSFNVQLRCSGGTVTVESITGDVPDGGLAVNGHEDDSVRTIGVSRTGVTGVHVASASGSTSKVVA